MKFNQVIWDALEWAYNDGCPYGLDAITAYAAACDGSVQWVLEPTQSDHSDYVMKFIPNPIPKY